MFGGIPQCPSCGTDALIKEALCSGGHRYECANGHVWSMMAAPQPVQRPDWDQYFMGIAAAVAARADCRRRRIGAVIVDEDRRIVSTGYNGAPAGMGSCLAGDCPRGMSDVPSFTQGNQNHSDCISLHAEQNAIAWADRSRTKGASIYIHQLDNPDPCPPCDMCAKLIKAAGIVKVYHS